MKYLFLALSLMIAQVGSVNAAEVAFVAEKSLSTYQANGCVFMKEEFGFDEQTGDAWAEVHCYTGTARGSRSMHEFAITGLSYNTAANTIEFNKAGKTTICAINTKPGSIWYGLEETGACSLSAALKADSILTLTLSLN